MPSYFYIAWEDVSDYYHEDISHEFTELTGMEATYVGSFEIPPRFKIYDFSVS